MVNEEMPELYSIACYVVPLLLRRQGPPPLHRRQGLHRLTGHRFTIFQV